MVFHPDSLAVSTRSLGEKPSSAYFDNLLISVVSASGVLVALTRFLVLMYSSQSPAGTPKAIACCLWSVPLSVLGLFFAPNRFGEGLLTGSVRVVLTGSVRVTGSVTVTGVVRVVFSSTVTGSVRVLRDSGTIIL